MIFFAAFPSSVCRATWVRSMSPVAKWQMQYLLEMLGACVPLPVGESGGVGGGGRGIREKMIGWRSQLRADSPTVEKVEEDQ